MARCVVRPGLQPPERYHLPRGVIHIDRRLRFYPDSEQRTRFDSVLVEKQIGSVKMDRRSERPLRARDTRHMIDMGVRQKNVDDGEMARATIASRSSTSSPGSISTASRLCSPATTNPFFMKGGTARLSTIMAVT